MAATYSYTNMYNLYTVIYVGKYTGMHWYSLTNLHNITLATTLVYTVKYIGIYKFGHLR